MRLVEITSILFGTSLLVAGGCVPTTMTEIPGLSGRVVTADHRPVPNAVVTVRQLADYPGRPRVSFQMTTDAYGHFSRSERSRWMLVPTVPIDALIPAYTATAGVDGRQSKPFRLGGDGMTGPFWFGLGNNGSRGYDLHDLVIQPTDSGGP